MTAEKIRAELYRIERAAAVPCGCVPTCTLPRWLRARYHRLLVELGRIEAAE